MIGRCIASAAVGARDLADQADVAQLTIQAQRIFVAEVAAQGDGTTGEECVDGRGIAQAEESGEGPLGAGPVRTRQELPCEDQVEARFRGFAHHRPGGGSVAGNDVEAQPRVLLEPGQQVCGQGRSGGPDAAVHGELVPR